MTMAAVFLAQAMNIQLSISQQLGILLILMLTSKGAAAVTGGGFITLAATLAATNTIPVAGMALLIGVDRFMSEARSITNLIGNGVATVAVARWEGSSISSASIGFSKAASRTTRLCWKRKAPKTRKHWSSNPHR